MLSQIKQCKKWYTFCTVCFRIYIHRNMWMQIFVVLHSHVALSLYTIYRFISIIVKWIIYYHFLIISIFFCSYKWTSIIIAESDDLRSLLRQNGCRYNGEKKVTTGIWHIFTITDSHLLTPLWRLCQCMIIN